MEDVGGSVRKNRLIARCSIIDSWSGEGAVSHPSMEDDDVAIVAALTCHRRYGALLDTGTGALEVRPNKSEMAPRCQAISDGDFEVS